MTFNVASLCAVVLLALVSVGSVAAVLSPSDYPEVIPGPGLPSLASLGLTSKDLYEGTGLLGKREPLTPQFTRVCNNNGCGRPPRADAQACINFLRNLGTQPCVAPGPDIVMCRAGAAVIHGTNIRGGNPVSSFCADVALGGQHVIDFCTDGSGNVSGADAANGNGDLIVSIERC